MATRISTDAAPAAVGVYSQAVQASDGPLFISGQLPIDPATGSMVEAPKGQALQCLENVKSIVEAAGLRTRDIIKLGVFTTSDECFAPVNEAFEEFFAGFDGVFPARAMVCVSALPKGASVEIEAIAWQ